MSSVITTDFEKWKAQQVTAVKPVVLDEFVFAYLPGLDPTQAISRDEKLPATNQIVHRQAVNKTGLASENAVAYSVTLGTEVGNFDFNWIGLINKASGVIGMITHAPAQKKIKTANGLQGNVLTRSFLLEFDGAATETAITTTAETWQIDFTARLSGMDDMQRLINTDSYGEAAFFGDSFAVVRQGEQYIVKKGLAYVGGLRGILAFDQTLNSLRNTRVYADFSYQGNLVSQWQTVVKMTAANELNNYVDAAGYPHYVFAVAQVDGNGNVMDLRIKGSLNERDIANLNSELDRMKQDYATKSALNVVRDNANNRLSKAENGADIPDKSAFINHLGLRDTVDLAKNAYPKTGGIIEGKVWATNDIEAKGWIGATTLYDRHKDGRWSQAYSEAFPPTAAVVGAYSRDESNSRFALKNSQETFTCGNLHVDATHDWSGIEFKKPSGYNTTLTSNPDSHKHMLTLRYRDPADNELHSVDIRKKSGSMALTDEAIPIGGIIIWLSEKPYPSNFLPLEGQWFNARDNPELARLYPAGSLPDMRGFVPRGWDNGRGVDPGRQLASSQGDAIRNITGQLNVRAWSDYSVVEDAYSAFHKSRDETSGLWGISGQSGRKGADIVSFDASRVVTTAHENRMKNIAVQFLVRAR
ncbi:tail fiber protein [Xenorhabdus vietnamensis]|uniref:Tail fiber protein n=1 Tax=Xenorhabdus vietnamensis TaxID=351656 RepID=A0A1Y2SJ14_9GAMM|nr:phage tail protein [Xenorhabdus vietnamensis]OTA17567.1 tail fiber protein [Xenorhabdus vietnamensis]